jgi:hypothetical protein
MDDKEAAVPQNKKKSAIRVIQLQQQEVQPQLLLAPRGLQLPQPLLLLQRLYYQHIHHLPYLCLHSLQPIAFAGPPWKLFESLR